MTHTQSNISLLTIVRGRRDHLHNMIRGVAEQRTQPREMIIVFMNEAVPERLPDPGCPLYLHRIDQTAHQLPLAAARNLAAGHAQGSILAFLDVDCIPHPDYLTRLQRAVTLTHGLVMGDIRYLPAATTDGKWSYSHLEARAEPHPRRPRLPEGESLISLPYHLFWSLSFGLQAAEFARLGGFDAAYQGYGGEDTDFAFNARQSRLPFYGCDARAYHQHHPVYSPPYNHLRDIVTNARRFHDKWQMWPMEGWLKQFEAEGLIDWQSDAIEILRTPDPELISTARSSSPFG